MSEIIHRTSLLSKGPWLIPRERLLALDKLIASELEKLERYRQTRIDEAVEKELSEKISRLSKDAKLEFDRKAARKKINDEISVSYYHSKEYSLIINLAGNRRVSVASFEEALRDPALLNEESTGFTLSIRAADIKCNLKIPVYSNSLELEVAPDQHPVAKGLFASLRSWVDTIKPPHWQKIWLNIADGGSQWFLWIVTLFIPLLYFAFFAQDVAGSARAARQAESIAILKSGISETNQHKALELILSYESGAIPKERTYKVPAWAMWLLFGGPILCIALSFYPKIVLGIGTGEESIKKWGKWMNIVGITFPLWVVGTFVWPKIQQLLTDLF